jgi:hypothetical protein
VSQNSAADFDNGERDVDDQTDERETSAGLQTYRGRLRRWHGFSEN